MAAAAAAAASVYPPPFFCAPPSAFFNPEYFQNLASIAGLTAAAAHSPNAATSPAAPTTARHSNSATPTSTAEATAPTTNGEADEATRNGVAAMLQLLQAQQTPAFFGGMFGAQMLQKPLSGRSPATSNRSFVFPPAIPPVFLSSFVDSATTPTSASIETTPTANGKVLSAFLAADQKTERRESPAAKSPVDGEPKKEDEKSD